MLAAQLAQSASLSAKSLKDQKYIDSYLFPPHQARQHDLDTIFQLAQNGLQLLATSSSSLKTFKSPLFSRSTKFVDRTRLSPEENHTLNEQIKDLLFAISPFLTEQGASNIIEWLVRRYRANEFNVDVLLTIFLPYHNTPHFVKLVSILHIQPSSPWAFLNAHKKATKPLYRDTLVHEMLKNHFLAAIVFDILPTHVAVRTVHRTVTTFAVAVTMEYLSKLSIEAVHLSFLMPSLLVPLENSESADVSESCLLLVGYLTSRVKLDPDAMEAIMASISHMKAQPDACRLIKGIALILQGQSDPMPLPESLLRVILALPNFQQVVQQCWETITNRSFLQPLSQSLALRISTPLAFDLLSRLSIAPNLDQDGVNAIATAMLHALTTFNDDSTKEKVSIILSKLYQRHPEHLVFGTGSFPDQNPLIRPGGTNSSNLKSPLIINDSVDDAVVLLTSTNKNQRIRGLRAIIKVGVSAGDESALVQENLLDMVQGHDNDILEILYSDPIVLLQLVTSDSLTDALVRTLSGASEVAETHVDFISRWAPENPESRVKLGLAISHHLLLTKSRFKRSAVLWKLIRNSISPVFHEGIFSGLGGLYTTELEELKGEAPKMADLNEKLISLIAENLRSSTHYALALNILVGKLGSSTSGVSEVHALLVLHEIIRTKHDRNGWELGMQILDALDQKDLGMFRELGYKSDMLESLKRPDFLRIVSKTEHGSTKARLYASLLLILPSIPKPSIRPINWMAEAETTPESQFADFRRRLYTFLNINEDVGAFAPLVLRDLFATSQKETFFLLASIWSSSKENHEARLSALKHGQAMIRALVNPKPGVTPFDLQILLPLLFPALSDSLASIRNAAIGCVNHLTKATPLSNPEVAEIYGLECLPTEITASLRFTSSQVFATYTKNLVTRMESISLDPEAFTRLHTDLLTPSPEETNEELRYKKRLLSYLASHACSWPKVSVRISILTAIGGFQDASKLSLLEPLLQSLVSPEGVNRLRLGDDDGYIYVKQLLAMLDVADSAYFEHDSSLAVLFNLLRCYFSNPQHYSIASPVLSTTNTIIKVLNPNQRLQLARELLSVSTTTPPIELLQLLSTTLALDSVVNPLIQEICAEMPSHHSPKRQRKDSDGPVLKISTSCQAMMSSSVERSPTLLKHLLQCLEQTVDTRGLTRTELIHVQGVLITTLQHVSQFVPPTASITPQLRIDVLVNLIKDSAQPHLVHQALLLIAALVPWSSDSLLHHLLPILVSTGSYISPRDDLYSARVAEKTIDSVIPVMTTYLRNEHPKRSALQIASRPYLDVFIDAADGIPSHRRTSFFVHLLSVLGTVDFTVPICLLLLERIDGSDGKRQAEKLELAVSLIHCQEANHRIALLSDMIDDILSDANNNQGYTGSFVSSLRKETVSSPVHALRLIRILDFTQKCLESCKASSLSLDEEQSQRLLSAIVRLQSVADGSTFARGHAKLSHQVQGAVFVMLKLVPSTTMIFTCLQLLRSNDEDLQTELFALLSKHLPMVTKEARELVSDSIKLVLSSIKDVVANPSNARLASAAYRALNSVANTSRPQELSELTELLPLVTTGTYDPGFGSTAVDTLSTLCTSIGPRVLPHITLVVKTCCALLAANRSSRVSVTSISILRQLLDTSSAFWTRADMDSFLSSYMETGQILNGEPKDALTSLSRRMARQLPSQEFIAALASCRGHLRTQNGTITVEQDALVFSLLIQCFKGSGKARVGSESRTILDLLMDSWDDHETLPDNAPSFKTFTELTTKLNENSFKPLHRVLFDWAWTADEHATLYSRERRVLHYCHAMSGVIVILKGLMTPYLSPFLTRATELLNLWSQQTEFTLNPELWKRVIGLIEQAALMDDGALWRDDVVGAIASALVRQLGYSMDPRKPWMIVSLGDCIGAVGSIAVDAGYLKGLNIELLMHTRSEEASIRLGALECARKLWAVNGPRLVGWKHETIPFLHECADDENDEVIAKARDLNAYLDRL